MTARFITLEGIDGAGKSTHVDALAAHLRAGGAEVVVTREPGGTPMAERLRDLVLHAPMDAMSEALLVFAARRDHLANVIEPALARGATVLCDRFTDATFAYQGFGRGFDLDLLSRLEDWVQQGRQPDLTLWFDLLPSTAAKRRAAIRTPDRFESQDTEFFTRVRNGYVDRMTTSPHRFSPIDASGTREQVWAQVLHAVESRAW